MPSQYIVHPLTPDPAGLLRAGDARWTGAQTIAWGDAPYATRFRALWSPDALHIRFDAADERPWHTKTTRDDRLWEEEVVEVFLDPAQCGADYAEIEISPANVVCDLIVRSPWPTLVSDPAWHVAGMETSVGSWRDPDAGPDGWSAIARVPWDGLRSIAPHVRMPPAGGDVWNFNVYRIKRPSGPDRPGDDVRLLAWSPTGGPSFHVPERFGKLKFL